MRKAFGPFSLDTQRRELRRDGNLIQLEPKVFDLLLFLVSNTDRVLSRDEIFEHVWEGRIVSDVTLSAHISSLRRSLGDDGKRQEIIKTVHGRGFRFVANVVDTEEVQEPPSKNRSRRNVYAAVVLFAALFLAWISYEKWNAGSVTAGKPGIAVLPFENVSGDPGQDYFADGLSEDIIFELAQFDLFHVISRSSSFGYRRPNAEIEKVAQDLGVRYVVEGNLRRSASGLSVTTWLTDTRSLEQVWTKRYEVTDEEIFGVRDDIATGIATTVSPEFLSAEMTRSIHLRPEEFGAWDLFIRGYWHLLRFTKPDNKTAQRLLNQAIQIDPMQANYHGILSVTHLMDALYGWEPNRAESLNTALLNAERGLALDDRDALVLRAMGLVHFFSRNHTTALEYFERAVDANSGEAENLALLGASLGVNGDYKGSLEMFQRAISLSPQDEHIATWYNYLSIAAFVDERYEEAAEWSRRTILENPDFPGGHRTLAASSGVMEEFDEAQEAAERLRSLVPEISLEQMANSLPYFIEDSDLERYLDGLRLAGIPEK